MKSIRSISPTENRRYNYFSALSQSKRVRWSEYRQYVY